MSEGAVDLQTLVSGYKDQLQTTAEGLRQRGQALQEGIQQNVAGLNMDQVKAQLEPQVQSVQTQITDLSPASRAASKPVVTVYVLVTLALCSATVGHVLGGVLLAPVIGLLFSGLLAALTAFVLVPAYTVQYSRTNQELKDEERQMLVVAAGLPMGILSGYALSGCYLAYLAPPTVLLPLAIALVLATLGPKLADNRLALLGAAVGAPVLAELIVGVVTGSLGGSYLLYTLVTGALYACALQLVLANEQFQVQTQAVALLATQLAVQALLTVLTAYSYEGYQQLKQSQA